PASHQPRARRPDGSWAHAPKWNVAKHIGQAPDIARIGDQRDRPQPAAAHQQPGLEVAAQRRRSRTDAQSLAERPAGFSEPPNHLAPGSLVERPAPAAPNTNSAFPASVSPLIDPAQPALTSLHLSHLPQRKRWTQNERLAVRLAVND